MIDFETIGNGKNACVVQIGACEFNPLTGEILSGVSYNVDAESAIESGAEMDASTVYWWLSQSKEAIASILASPRLPIHGAFTALNIFLADAQTIWSHATFDFVILTETLKRLKIEPKFHYKAARDIRTLMDLSGVSTKDLKREGVHHNGLDDAMFQVKYCVMAMRKLSDHYE